MKSVSARTWIVSSVLFVLGVFLTASVAAQQTCVESSTCDNGQKLETCNEICGPGCFRMWYQIGGAVFDCGADYDCTTAANQAVNYCLGGGAAVCQTPCGSGCCDDSGGVCCNEGCLTGGQTCCGAGVCDVGWKCSSDTACIPESAIDCGDGTFCEAGECFNGGCLAAGETACGTGVCGAAETCVEGLCLPVNGVTCQDGSVCPENTACASGQCCVEGFLSYDPISGYCCGAGPEAGLCACPVSCAGLCCPADTMCCGGNYCAPSADACPTCPANAPKFCSDHTCVPQDATCCGGGFYCMNSLSCMHCPGGQTACGDCSTPAFGNYGPDNTGSAVLPTGAPPAGASTTGKTPGTPDVAAQPGAIPGQVAKAGGGGCSMSGSSAPPDGFIPLTVVLLLLAGLAVRRSRIFMR